MLILGSCIQTAAVSCQSTISVLDIVILSTVALYFISERFMHSSEMLTVAAQVARKLLESLVDQPSFETTITADTIIFRKSH